MEAIASSNQRTYTARSIVQHYTQLKRLQPAEQAILNQLRELLPGMRMLDMGVGGGRTTQHFSDRVLDYVGIDYSAEMIAACQQRFATRPHATFEVCDARDMSRFSDHSFDFILFSFNGIDYSSHADRLKILQEIRRVGKPGGYFCFSSHNLQGMKHHLDWRNQIRLNPIATYANLVMLALLRCFNRSIHPTQLTTAAHATIRDESHNFRLKTYYVSPQEQINQLKEGFTNIQIYSWSSGAELKTEEDLLSCLDMWLYYLCTIQ